MILFSLFLCLSLIFEKTFGFSFSYSAFFKRNTFKLRMQENDANDDDNDSNKPGRSKFDRALDDFIGKRYGNGEAFYGKRLADMDDEEYLERYGDRSSKQQIDWNAQELKENSILLVGGMEEIGQWISFELVEKGFSVRVVCNDIKQAIEIYGLPGNNVDLVELNSESSNGLYVRAVDNVQAVVICSAFDPAASGPFSKLQNRIESLNIASKILDVASDLSQSKGKSSQLKKVLSLSRYVPSEFLTAGSKSNLLDSFFGTGSSSLSEGRYNDFRSIHARFEDKVRSIRENTGIEYAILRAPPLVDSIRDGGQNPLMLLQEGSEEASLVNEADTLRIGMLDMAEAAVQTLIQDSPFITYTLSEVPQRGTIPSVDEDVPLIRSAAMEEEYGASPQKMYNDESEREPRRAYYSILDMDDVDMRTSYMLKPKEAYIALLEEDESVENYWTSRLANLEQD